MKYSELLTKKKQYKYSANICFDLKNEERLEEFIPNITTTEILGEYLYGIINNSTVHSRILYGSYGTGKSHLLTVLCAILGHINTNGKGFAAFEKSISKYDKRLACFLKDFAYKGKPYLVVPVYSDFPEFDKCITFSLKKELDRNGIDICFKSYFQEALSLLKNWVEGGESAHKLNEICEKLEIELKDLYRGLQSYETGSERKFNEVFKAMTYGATFVSAAGNLIDNLELANKSISDVYQGIVFVFDEFGRYIEDQGENIKVKTIQDLAEYCDHSDFNDYLILVSHKQLSLYTDKMRTELSEEWKKIEGRFKATSINVKYDQCLSLIPHIIPKTKEWEAFNEKYKSELNELYNQAWDFKGFLLPPEGGNPFEGGYPLHPITLYALDRLSKRVAQNERTFFTYLASDEENALFQQLGFLDDDKFHFIGLDAIYDYFESNIRSYRSSDVYSVYKKFQYAINKLGNQDSFDVELKVLKVMAVIYIISDTTVLSADKNTLKNVIDEDKQIICDAIDNLERLKIIKFMRQYGYYDFLDSSIYDFDSMIDEKVETISEDMVVTVLNEEFANFAIYPYEYNLRYHMNRIFIPVFVKKQDLNKKSFARTLPEYYDGVIAFVVDKDYSLDEYQKMDGIPERMILLVNTNTEEIIHEVRRYIAIKYFYAMRGELKKDDPIAEKELSLYLEEQRGIVADQVRTWRGMCDKSTVSIIDKKEVAISSEEELSKKASELMNCVYTDTIIVNNDLINKNNVSGAIRLARIKALSCIMEDDEIYGNCTAMSPEHSILRAVLSKNNIFDDKNAGALNYLPDERISGVPVQTIIRKYFKRCEKGRVAIQELYAALKKPPFGLRDGYIPILLAYELRKYENVSLYFHGSERDYVIDELLKSLDNPEDYSLYLCNWSNEQSIYIKGLEEVFAENLGTQSKNRLKNLHIAMNMHFTSVPKTSRTTEKYVSAKAKQYREIMSISYNDYYKFFFEVLPHIDNDFQALVYQVKSIKDELENVLQLQSSEIERIIRKTLQADAKDNIVKKVSNRYEDDWVNKRHKSFDYHTNAFLEYVQNMNKAELDSVFVQDIAKLISGFEIDYWSDSKIEDFEDIFMRVIQQLDDYEVQSDINDNEIQIVLKNGGENSKVTQFDKQELSANSQMMFNKMKSTIDNFGHSISHEEKMQVIAKLLAEIM